MSATGRRLTWGTTRLAFVMSVLAVCAIALLGSPARAYCTAIDTTPPTTTAEGLENAIVNHDVLVTLAAGDTGSGVAATYYRVLPGYRPIDGLAFVDSPAGDTVYPPQLYMGGAVNVSWDGPVLVEYWSEDVQGNTETRNHVYIQIDKTGPTSWFASASDGWSATGQTVVMNGSDPGTGIEGYRYTVNGEGPFQCNGTFTVSTPGENAVRVWAYDYAGNEESPVHNLTLRVDTTPPAVSINNPTEIWRDSSSVWFDATDTQSGTDQVWYTLNGGPATLYSDSFSVDSDIVSNFEFWAIDKVGNKSATQTAEVRVDSADPSASIEDAVFNGSTLWTRDGSLVLSADDAAPSSGIDGIWYRSFKMPDYAKVAPGTRVSDLGGGLAYYALDNVGRSSQHWAAETGVDNTGPTTIRSFTDTGWTNRDQLLSAYGTDGQSGCDETYYRLTNNGSSTPAQLLTANQTISDEGTTTVELCSVDRLGNRETTQTFDVMIDKSAPVSSIRNLPVGVVDHDVTIDIDAVDALSGVFGIAYRLDDGRLETYRGPITITKQGTTRIEYWSGDNAGNSETEHKFATVTIDKLGFVTTITGAPGTWVNRDVSFGFTTNSPNSPVLSTWYSFGEDTWMRYTPGTTVTVSDEGTTDVYFYSRTEAGDETQRWGTIRIDKTLPVWATTVASKYVEKASIKLDADDALSGMAGMEWSLDGGPYQDGSNPVVYTPGTHTLRARAYDMANNIATKSWTFTVVSNSATVTRPKLPKYMDRGTKYELTGVLHPRHGAGTKPVRITLQRKIDGHYRTVWTFLTTAENPRGVDHSQYVGYVRWTTKGAYRLQANDVCGAHEGSSAWTYVSVR